MCSVSFYPAPKLFTLQCFEPSGKALLCLPINLLLPKIIPIVVDVVVAAAAAVVNRQWALRLLALRCFEPI